MRKQKILNLTINDELLHKLNHHYKVFTYLNGNKSNHSFISISEEKTFNTSLFSFEQLQAFIANYNDWVFGYFPYDFKNIVEHNLSSDNEDFIQLKGFHFYIPKLVIEIIDNHSVIHYLHQEDLSGFEDILAKNIKINEIKSTVNLKQKVSKEQYLENVYAIKEHIRLGDIYEMNYCHEFYSNDAKLNPITTYSKLNKLTKAPFSCLYKNSTDYILSASPERFLKKEDSIVTSQPIKGTAKRGETKEEDVAIKTTLENDEKERAENIMIVDLVRNDLSKTAAKQSVKVEELCKVYTFDTVHQMISTVKSTIKKGLTGVEVIKHAFPMGSMTGAPKIEAMKLIEHYEDSKRGIYSGAIGYFKPNGDFDFNVVIRSILYNQELKKCSFMVGGAITLKSEPEQEYKETLLKAKALKKALSM